MENLVENRVTAPRAVKTYGLRSRRTVFGDANNRRETNLIQKDSYKSHWKKEVAQELASKDPIVDIYDDVKDNYKYEYEYIESNYQDAKEKEVFQVKERIIDGFLNKQQQLRPETRAMMVNWLIWLSYKLELPDDVLQLSVKIMDELTCKKSISRKKYQLVAVVSSFIAAKYQEHFAPRAKYYIHFAEDGFTKDDITRLEETVLNILKFRIEYITPQLYFDRFLRAANIIKGDEDVFVDKDKKRILYFLEYLSELILPEHEFAKYLPSQIAASIVWILMKRLDPSAIWTRTTQFYTNYSMADLKPCIIDIGKLLTGVSTTNVKIVKKKFSGPRYGRIALENTPVVLKEFFEST